MSPVIEIEGLSKRFGSTQAVSDLSFSVGEGTIVGFLGPNGAGKSTTLRALLGLVRPDSGTALIDGKPFVELDDPIRQVGAVLEGGGAHPGRSGRNHLRALALAGGVPSARVEEVLALVDLDHGDSGRRVKGYSLGMKQRLGLAAALLGEPRALILDEPANGLDPAGIRWLRDLLRSMADRGHSVLISSHVLAEVAQTADQVVVINRGRSIAQAPIEELLATRGGSGMRVAGPEIGPLVEALRAAGATVSAADGSSAIVGGKSGEQIGAAALEHGVVLAELTPVESSLEDIFLELTDDEEPDQMGHPS